MPRVKRNRPQKSAKVHDRRSQDLPRNAEVAAIEVDDPLALEPGERIVTLRSIRNDPLGRLHSHRQVDEAQYLGGRAFQDDWEKAERGPQAVDPTREYVDATQMREPIIKVKPIEKTKEPEIVRYQPLKTETKPVNSVNVQPEVMLSAVCYAQILQPPKAYQYMINRSRLGDQNNHKS